MLWQDDTVDVYLEKEEESDGQEAAEPFHQPPEHQLV